MKNTNEVNYYDNMFDGVDGLKNYYNEIDKISGLSQEEEIELARRIKNGDQEAKQRFIEANLKLVRYVISKMPYNCADIDDSIQEGNIGLMRAVEDFDPEKGCRFSTYAVGKIKASVMSLSINYHSTIRKSKYVAQNISKYNRFIDELAKKLQHTPSKYEISEALGITIEQIDQIDLLQQKPIRMSGTLIDGKDRELDELVPDPNVDVEAEVLEKISNDDTAKLLNNGKLTNKEKIIIYYLFGFDGSAPKSQTEIAKMLDLTRPRVSQIARSALKKINAEENAASQDEKNLDEYVFDTKTRRVLKKAKSKMPEEEYNELKRTIIKIKESGKFQNLSIIELLILILGFGIIKNKHYAPIEISDVLCADYYAIAPFINNLLRQYQSRFNEFEQECSKTLVKK